MPKKNLPFKFKQFSVVQLQSAAKIGTDGVLLGAWSFLDYEPSNILDIGTGTGVIALMQAQKFKNAQIDALEFDYSAFEESKFNFEASPWKNRLNSLNGNYKSQNFNISYDLLLTNPPFYKNSLDTPSYSRNLARQEKHLPFDVLFEKSFSLLNDNGNFQLIIPYQLKNEILFKAEKFNLFPNKICSVHGNINSAPVRLLLSFSKSKKSISQEKLFIEIERGIYTEEYKNLTKDFYLNF